MRVSDSDSEMLRYLAEQGIALGDRCVVTARQPFDGPITVRFGDDRARARPHARAGDAHRARNRLIGRARPVCARAAGHRPAKGEGSHDAHHSDGKLATRGVGGRSSRPLRARCWPRPRRRRRPAYHPSGPQVGVARSALTGWTVCHRSNDNDQNISLATILAACDGDYLLLAGGPVGGLRSTSSRPRRGPTSSPTRARATRRTDANGSGWYFNGNVSWGFAP